MDFNTFNFMMLYQEALPLGSTVNNRTGEKSFLESQTSIWVNWPAYLDGSSFSTQSFCPLNSASVISFALQFKYLNRSSDGWSAWFRRIVFNIFY